MNTQTALQVTDFNFYGDNLIALKDNATGEIYTAINSVLRGIGFKDEQVRYQRSKWIKDKTLSKGVLKFNIPTNGGYQLTECISVHKLQKTYGKPTPLGVGWIAHLFYSSMCMLLLILYTYYDIVDVWKINIDVQTQQYL